MPLVISSAMRHFKPVAMGDVLQLLEEEAGSRDDRFAVGIAIIDVRQPHLETARGQLIQHSVGGIFEQLILLEDG